MPSHVPRQVGGVRTRLEQDATEREADPRLSRISTTWSQVGLTHQGPAEAAASARRQLLDRYGDAVCRYPGKVLRRRAALDEVFREFGDRLIRGDLAASRQEQTIPGPAALPRMTHRIAPLSRYEPSGDCSSLSDPGG